MKMEFIRCPSCQKKNRIPSDKIGLKIKCGSCGSPITVENPDKMSCKLCNKKASDGIYLSDGSIIHTTCYDLLYENKTRIEHELINLKHKSVSLERELKRRESILFKVISVFSKSEIDSIDIEKNISTIKIATSKSSESLAIIQSRLTSLYDYFLTYPPDWDRRRDDVISRDGENCSECGRWRRLHLHHKIPLSKGGTNKLSNLKLLCEECHSKRHGGRDFSGTFDPSETAYSKRVANLRFAIEHGRKVEFRYRKPTDKGYKKRIVKPAELVNVPHQRDGGSTLCVSGFCELRKANRTFALKRMKGLKVINKN